MDSHDAKRRRHDDDGDGRGAYGEEDGAQRNQAGMAGMGGVGMGGVGMGGVGMDGAGDLQLPPGAMEQFMLTPEFSHFRQHMIDGFKAQNQPPPDADTIKEQYRVWKTQQLLQFRQRQMLMAQQLMAQQLMAQQAQQQATGKRSAADAGLIGGGGHDGERERERGGGGGGGGGDGAYKVSFRVATDAVGTIMGSKGASVKAIQNESGARVVINRDEEPGTNERIVHVSGTREAVESARRMIQERVDDWNADGGGKSSAQGAGAAASEGEHEVVRVPSSAVGFLIGAGGSAIHELQQESGARVRIAPGTETSAEGVLTRVVNVTGKRAAVDAAKELIGARVALFNASSAESRAANSLQRANGDVDETGEGWRSPHAAGAADESDGDEGPLIVHIEQRDAIGYIIGRGGSIVNSIESECGVRIRVKREADPAEIRISGGTERDCQSAKEQILKRLEEWRSFGAGGQRGEDQTIFVPMPRNSLGFIIGKGGTSIGAIESECHVRMSVMRDHTPPGVQVMGPAVGVEKARGMLFERLEEWQANGPPPPPARDARRTDDWYAQAGPGGGGPRGGGGPTTTLEVLIPDRLVRHVIGNRGSKIDSIEMETGVRIKIPKDEPLIGPDECKRVLITGTPAACAAARWLAEEAAYREEGGPPSERQQPWRAGGAAGCGMGGFGGANFGGPMGGNFGGNFGGGRMGGGGGAMGGMGGGGQMGPGAGGGMWGGPAGNQAQQAQLAMAMMMRNMAAAQAGGMGMGNMGMGGMGMGMMPGVGNFGRGGGVSGPGGGGGRGRPGDGFRDGGRGRR